MSGWLLDTNVLSELRRPRPEKRVVRFVAERPLEQLFVSEVTLAEIRFGIERIAEPIRRAEIQDWLTHELRPMFESRVLPITETALVLVTRDRSAYVKARVPLADPWTEEPNDGA